LEDVNNGPQETQDEPNTINEGRWVQMKCLIKVDVNLDQDKANELWQVLDKYVNVFALHKGELGCCDVGVHVVIDTQGLPPCHTNPNMLSFWEEAKVNW
jgi:hypothetical protein